MRALGKKVPIDVKFRCFGRTMVLGVSWEGLRGSCEGTEFDSIVNTTLNISCSVALKLVCHANLSLVVFMTFHTRVILCICDLGFGDQDTIYSHALCIFVQDWC